MLSDGCQCGPDPFGDIVAFELPLVFGQQVDLNVGNRGTAAQKVMADETIEIVGRGGTHVYLIIDHIRILFDYRGHFQGHPRGLLQGRTFRHVEDDLELALVVKRQHLDLDIAETDHGHGAKQQQGDHGKKQQPPARVTKKRIHDFVIEPGEDVVRDCIVVVALGTRPGLQEVGRRPGGDCESDDQ